MKRYLLLALFCLPLTAQAEDYRSLIVTTLISTGGDTVVPVPPTPGPGPVPLRDCPVCKGTGFITHGDGHKTECPENHSAAERAAHYKRIAGMMGGVARARPDIDADDLVKVDGCQCESGGPCTCNGDCDCAECTCEDCPGKTSKSITRQVCSGSGCQMVTRTARKVNGHWWWQYGDRSWYGGTGKQPKLREVEEGLGGKWQYKGTQATKTNRIVSETENGYVQIGRLGSPALSRAPGQHSHRCGVRGCGHVWSHYPGQSHRCPSCGGLTDSNYAQISAGASRYVEWNLKPRPVVQQPRRMFSFRRSSG